MFTTKPITHEDLDKCRHEILEITRVANSSVSKNPVQWETLMPTILQRTKKHGHPWKELLRELLNHEHIQSERTNNDPTKRSIEQRISLQLASVIYALSKINKPSQHVAGHAALYLIIETINLAEDKFLKCIDEPLRVYTDLFSMNTLDREKQAPLSYTLLKRLIKMKPHSWKQCKWQSPEIQHIISELSSERLKNEDDPYLKQYLIQTWKSIMSTCPVWTIDMDKGLGIVYKDVPNLEERIHINDKLIVSLQYTKKQGRHIFIQELEASKEPISAIELPTP